MRDIYVETLIDAPVERIWQATQDPVAHRRWDARFGRIDPVPGSTPARFRYATRVLPGVRDTETFVYLKLTKQTYAWGTR